MCLVLKIPILGNLHLQSIFQPFAGEQPALVDPLGATGSTESRKQRGDSILAATRRGDSHVRHSLAEASGIMFGEDVKALPFGN